MQHRQKVSSRKAEPNDCGDDEEIYVEQPHGFEVTGVNGKKGKYVCKLKKGLYGRDHSSGPRGKPEPLG